MHRVSLFLLAVWVVLGVPDCSAQEAAAGGGAGWLSELSDPETLVKLIALSLVSNTIGLLIVGSTAGLHGGIKDAALASGLMFLLQGLSLLLVYFIGPVLGPIYGTMLALLCLFVPGSVAIKMIYQVHFLNGLFAYFLLILLNLAAYHGLARLLG